MRRWLSRGTRAAAAAALLVLLLGAALPGRAAPGFEVVRFPAADGLVLSGTLFGEGPAGVVLAHMFPTDQRSWHTYARALAREGYMALAFDFRGYGRSGGAPQVAQLDRDVRGAAAFLRSRGARRIALVGASMGGTAVIKAAGTRGVEALVVISAPRSFRGLTVTPTELTRLTFPSLWVTSRDDAVTPEMRAMFAAAGGAKTLHVYSGAAHGTALFEGPHGVDLPGRILVFIARHIPPP